LVKHDPGPQIQLLKGSSMEEMNNIVGPHFPLLDFKKKKKKGKKR
jgi:hypothetical protein